MTLHTAETARKLQGTIDHNRINTILEVISSNIYEVVDNSRRNFYVHTVRAWEVKLIPFITKALEEYDYTVGVHNESIDGSIDLKISW